MTKNMSAALSFLQGLATSSQGWEAVYLSSSDFFALSSQEPSNSHWSCQVACVGWNMPPAGPWLPPRMGGKGLETTQIKTDQFRGLAQQFYSSIDSSLSFGAYFLEVSLPLEELWEHWDATHSYSLMVWMREEQTTRSLFPELKLIISWIMSELINLKFNIGWPWALMLKKKSFYFGTGSSRMEVFENHPTRLTHLRRINSSALGQWGEEGGSWEWTPSAGERKLLTHSMRE